MRQRRSFQHVCDTDTGDGKVTGWENMGPQMSENLEHSPVLCVSEEITSVLFKPLSCLATSSQQFSFYLN